MHPSYLLDCFGHLSSTSITPSIIRKADQLASTSCLIDLSAICDVYCCFRIKLYHFRVYSATTCVSKVTSNLSLDIHCISRAFWPRFTLALMFDYSSNITYLKFLCSRSCIRLQRPRSSTEDSNSLLRSS